MTRKIAWGREFSVFSNRKACPRWSGCSCRAGGIGGVPGCSAQRELRPPRIAVNTSGNAVCSCAQDFALILFFGRGRTRKIAWGREFSVFSNRKARPLGASPFHDHSQHLWQCSLQLRTGFRVDPFFWPRKNAEERGKSHGDGSFQCSVIVKPAPVGADAPAEPECSAQRELRLPRIAVNTSGNAVRSYAQDFALILF
jgi:hypothetical protein